MLRLGGAYLAFATLLLQIAVYIQPLLPEKFHIAPVCMSITHNLLSAEQHYHAHESYHDLVHHLNDLHHHDDHNNHNHQCQYCTVYADLVIPFDLGVNEVFEHIQIKLSSYRTAYWHVYYSLQALYVLPQGRAPPFSI